DGTNPAGYPAPRSPSRVGPARLRGAAELSTGCTHDEDDGAARRTLAQDGTMRPGTTGDRTMRRRAAVGAIARARNRERAGQGHDKPAAAAAARQTRRSRNTRQGAVRPQDRAREFTSAHHRLLFQGLSRRRDGAADQRPDLASHATLAQPQLGPSELD